MSEKLGQELRRIRQIAGSSLRMVEKETGISNAYLSQLESGAARNPSPQILAKLAEFYRVPYESLMEFAGYLHSGPPLGADGSAVRLAQGSGDRRLPSSLDIALSKANLNKEEEEMVAEYVAFLSARRKK
jgi:transcriptional regulator with XRE-family HTH domain